MGPVEPAAMVAVLMAARRAELAAAVQARIMRMSAEAGRQMADMVRSAAEEVAEIVAGDPPRGIAQLVDTWA